MAVIMNPYLSFKDNAADAIAFYQDVFGGKVISNTFGESGMPCEPEEVNLTMHAQLTTDNGLTLMASDTPKHMGGEPGPNGTISLSGGSDDEATLRGYFEKLSTGGGGVSVPLEKAPWGDTFGMCADKYGVQWMVNIAGQAPSETA